MKRLALILVLLGLLAGMTAEHVTISEFERRIYDFTNVERVKRGLQPLVYEDGLADLARRHSRNMANFEFFAHEDREGMSVGGRKNKYYPQLLVTSIGENLAFYDVSNKRFNASEIVVGWMNSPGHRANILDPQYTHLGVGVVLVDTRLYATQNFATPIVKLKKALPKSFNKNRSYCLDFEYLSPKSISSFTADLGLPNPNAKVPIGNNRFRVGSEPQAIVWTGGSNFRLTMNFKYGKGVYVLRFGWGDTVYSEGYNLKVK